MQKLFKPWYIIAIGFGLGKIFNYLPVGSIASIVAIPIWWMLVYFISYKIFLIFLIFGIIIGIYCCDKTNKVLGMHDHRSIVWDEFIGMWITLIVVPIHDWLWIIIAFVLFRIFDIIKPWPIAWIDRVVLGGFGIVIDDVIAGFISLCIILLLMNIF